MCLHSQHKGTGFALKLFSLLIILEVKKWVCILKAYVMLYMQYLSWNFFWKPQVYSMQNEDLLRKGVYLKFPRLKCPTATWCPHHFFLLLYFSSNLPWGSCFPWFSGRWGGSCGVGCVWECMWCQHYAPASHPTCHEAVPPLVLGRAKLVNLTVQKGLCKMWSQEGKRLFEAIPGKVFYIIRNHTVPLYLIWRARGQRSWSVVVTG